MNADTAKSENDLLKKIVQRFFICVNLRSSAKICVPAFGPAKRS
jgi:hypothetical protein